MNSLNMNEIEYTRDDPFHQLFGNGSIPFTVSDRELNIVIRDIDAKCVELYELRDNATVLEAKSKASEAALGMIYVYSMIRSMVNDNAPNHYTLHNIDRGGLLSRLTAIS